MGWLWLTVMFRPSAKKVYDLRPLVIPIIGRMIALSRVMKFALLTFLTVVCFSALGATPDIGIPENSAKLIKACDYAEVTGTNDSGGSEDFSIHNAKALSQFIQLLTSERYIAVPKSLQPQFKSLSNYKVRLSAKGVLLLELHVIADSVLDIPGETSFYMQSDQYSDNLMAPLLRLR